MNPSRISRRFLSLVCLLRLGLSRSLSGLSNPVSEPKPKQKLKLTRWAVLAALLVIVAGMFLYNSPGWRFGRAYSELQLGMSKTQVRKLFNREPDYECKLRSSEIWYVCAPDFLAGDFSGINKPSGSIFQTAKALPDVYDHVQLAFDSDDQLHAFTWIGETYTVESTTGSVSGSHFKSLPDANF